MAKSILDQFPTKQNPSFAELRLATMLLFKHREHLMVRLAAATGKVCDHPEVDDDQLLREALASVVICADALAAMHYIDLAAAICEQFPAEREWAEVWQRFYSSPEEQRVGDKC